MPEEIEKILELTKPPADQTAGEPTISKSARISRVFAFLALGSVIVFWLVTLGYQTYDERLYYFLDLFTNEGLLLFGLSLAAITCASIGLKVERLAIVITIVAVAGFLVPMIILSLISAFF
jgi:hypothetical protein